MRWAWRVGTIAGTRFYVHWTFPLLLLGIAAWQTYMRHTPAEVFITIGQVLMVFAMVVAHELAHVLTARSFGVEAPEVTLMPYGGVASIARQPDRPKQEFAIIMAGPLMNLVLLIAGSIVLLVARLVGLGDAWWLPLAEIMVWMNWWLVLINILPIFPVDGGQALRALLSMVVDLKVATTVVVVASKIAAVLMVALGLAIKRPELLILAAFVWYFSTKESAYISFREELNAIPIRQVMSTSFPSVSPTMSLRDAAMKARNGARCDFPVLQDGVLVGMLSQTRLADALTHYDPETPVSEAMELEFLAARPEDGLGSVVARLQAGGQFSIPVLEADALLGMLSLDQVYRLLVHRAHGDTGAGPGRS